LIAAGGLVGLLGIVIKYFEGTPETSRFHLKEGTFAWGTRIDFMNSHPNFAGWFAVFMFVLLACSLFYFARKPLGGEKH